MNPLTVPPKKEKVQNLLISTVCGVENWSQKLEAAELEVAGHLLVLRLPGRPPG